jgi:hypothetical protein
VQEAFLTTWLLSYMVCEHVAFGPHVHTPYTT